MPTLHVKVEGLAEGDRALRRFSAQVDDLRPVLALTWRDAGRRRPSALAAETTVRTSSATSLVVVGPAVSGRGGIYRVRVPDRLQIRERSLFYGRFSPARRETAAPRRPLIHIDEAAAQPSS